MIQEIHTRFTYFINEIFCLGEPIHSRKLVRKVLRIILKFCESKVDAIIEAKDLKVITMDEQITNLQTHDMNM